MATVKCSIEQSTMENDEGNEVDSTRATCSKCGHVTESFGTSDPSIDRCLATMRDECPLNEKNFYEED